MVAKYVTIKAENIMTDLLRNGTFKPGSKSFQIRNTEIRYKNTTNAFMVYAPANDAPVAYWALFFGVNACCFCI
jgi:hypothetical protein